MTKLEEVESVKVSTSEDEVNMYLGKGYRILKILSTKGLNGEHELVQASFILGK